MTDLIERLERAEGPSRELDAAIKARFYGGVPMLSPFNGSWCVYRAEATDPRKDRVLERPRSVPHEVWSNDRYTASIDAAMTLVPEGWRAGFEQAGAYDRSDLAQAWLWPFESSFDPDWQCGEQGYRDAEDGQRGYAKPPALALCIAALKAKEADNGKSC